jgi:DNA-binding NtrC family response regulator
VVVITAHGSERQAVAAMKAGATDYFRKPFDMDELLAAIRRSLESTRLALENEKLKHAAYDWPGNVRELENAIERLVALSPEGELDLSLLPSRAAAPRGDGESFGLRERVEAYERGIIVETLKSCRNNRSEAARRLGLSRATLHDKLRKHGLGPADADEREES